MKYLVISLFIGILLLGPINLIGQDISTLQVFTPEVELQTIYYRTRHYNLIDEYGKLYYNDCSCDIKGEKAEKALEAQALLYGVQAQFLCNKNDKAAKIMATLDKICSLYNNDCNCN